MAKKNELQSQLAGLPAFMQNVEDLGTADLTQYVIPPRLKVVQRISGPPFDSLFDPGDVVASPQLVRIAPVIKNENGKPTDQGTPFYFVPVYFFVEWCLWNPLEMKGSLPSIRERTTNPESDMVIKSRDQKLWSIPCPENPDLSCRYVEHLNFLITLTDEHEFAGTPMVMSFARAEHRSGTNFAALIKMRKAPIYGCRFAAHTAFRSNNKGNWYGIDVTNPVDGKPFIQDENFFRALKEVHEEFRAAHLASRVIVDYDNEISEPSVDSTVSAF